VVLMAGSCGALNCYNCVNFQSNNNCYGVNNSTATTNCGTGTQCQTIITVGTVTRSCANNTASTCNNLYCVYVCNSRDYCNTDAAPRTIASVTPFFAVLTAALAVAAARKFA
jgi:hypothetical protein